MSWAASVPPDNRFNNSRQKIGLSIRDDMAVNFGTIATPCGGGCPDFGCSSHPAAGLTRAALPLLGVPSLPEFLPEFGTSAMRDGGTVKTEHLGHRNKGNGFCLAAADKGIFRLG
jgi:hypothetical protein